MNPKKVYRLYREERLTVRKRGGCERAWDAGADGDPTGTHPALVARQRARTHWPAAGGSVCVGVMDDSGNAKRASSIPRIQVGLSSASWALLPSVEGCRAWWSATIMS